jgi:uncharacterized protein YbjQ (UPF0145 family)
MMGGSDTAPGHGANPSLSVIRRGHDRVRHSRYRGGTSTAQAKARSKTMGWFSKSDANFFLSTVVPTGDGARVGSYLGLVNGEAIIGANIFRDMFSSVRDVVGGRAGGYERALAGARDAALNEMISAARETGADGIVGIDFDYEVLGETNGMMMVTVSGTAVKMA